MARRDDEPKQREDKNTSFARVQAWAGVIGTLVAIMTTAQQYGFLDGVVPAGIVIPQFINRTGAQIEWVQINPSNREGVLRQYGATVTRAPLRGRWRGRLCVGDEIQFVDGQPINSVEEARWYFYGDRGDFATVRTGQQLPDGKPAPVGEVNAIGVARNCPLLDQRTGAG